MYMVVGFTVVITQNCECSAIAWSLVKLTRSTLHASFTSMCFPMNSAYLQDLMVFMGYIALLILQKLPLLILQLNISSVVGNVTYNLLVEITKYW